MPRANEDGREPEGIAVLLPCLNEETTVGKVVADFRAALPEARIYVFDNQSTDRTAVRARQAGAEVVISPKRGKGNVVRHMLRHVQAGIYVLADGDDTYPAEAAREMLRVLRETDADMVVGSRLARHDPGAFRLFHKLGNRLITGWIALLFRARLTDVLSGYRVLRRSCARGLHIRCDGFEVETEMTLQALVRDRRIVEVPVHYRARPRGSVSKLESFSDGGHIMKLVVLIFKDYKPLVFFSTLGIVAAILGIFAGWPPVMDYVRTRYVSHVPLALLAAALEILAVLFAGTGLVLNAIRRYHAEMLDALERAQQSPDDQPPRG